MKKASIIIPAHDEEKYIAKTLEAINHKDVETIVVCNGCTDKTEEVARNFKTKIINLNEKSVSKARNKGAEIAIGEKLIFLDADIVVSEDTLHKILDSNYHIGTAKAIPDEDVIMAKLLMKLKNIVNHFGQSTGLIFCNKDIFNKVGGFDENLTKREDGTFIRHAKRHGRFGVINSYVINNMRRFRKKGYLGLFKFWLREVLFPTDKDYEVVR